MRPSAVAILVLAALTAGCRSFLPYPDMRTAADRAHEIEPMCAGSPTDVPGPNAIDSAKAAYSYVHSSSSDGPEARIRGARIHVKPLPGYAKESLGRAIECHEVRVILGTEPALVDDPYALPGHWLDIDVDSDREGFVVLVRSDSFIDAREVLARAQRFVAARSVPAALAAP